MNNIDLLLHEKLQIALRLANENIPEVEKITKPLLNPNFREFTLTLIEQNKLYTGMLEELLLQIER